MLQIARQISEIILTYLETILLPVFFFFLLYQFVVWFICFHSFYFDSQENMNSINIGLALNNKEGET